MKALQALMWALTGLAILGSPGCHRDRGPREVVYVEPQEPDYVFVREPPPPVVVERRPARPGDGYVWIEGYWGWTGHKYAWERGRWVRPPRERVVWVAPRYEKFEHGHAYAPGHWREGPQERREEGRRDEGQRENRDRR